MQPEGAARRSRLRSGFNHQGSTRLPDSPMAHAMKARTLLATMPGFCVWVCASLQAGPANPVLPYAEIYQRATNEFAVASFFKPAESKTNDLPFTLAPLILQEVGRSAEALSRLDHFGALSLSNGVPFLDRANPAVYWQADTVQLKGKPHVRFAYVWACASAAYGSIREPDDALTAGQGKAGLALQGIRITLNSTGQPAIWEVLADSSGAELIFVSHALEAAALAEFRKALPGRRHAIERSGQETPKVIIARLIDDGPMAMGPIVYLSAGSRSVSTLICRCMPAQAKKLTTTSTYDLLPFPAATAQSLLAQTKLRAKEKTAFWPGDPGSNKRLELCLRLPSAF